VETASLARRLEAAWETSLGLELSGLLDTGWSNKQLGEARKGEFIRAGRRKIALF
jgi:hypothetical protein